MAHVDLDNAYEWFPNRMVTSTQRWSSRWLLGRPSLFLCHLTANSFNSRQPQRWRSCRLEIHADLEVGGFLGLQPPHGLAPLQSLVCCHFNILTSTSRDSRGSLWLHVYAYGHYIFAREVSYVRIGGALPRWRPPPHSPLIQLRIRFSQWEMNLHYMPHLSIKLGFQL